MATPLAMILRAPGTNCEEETAEAWQAAGASVEVWHVCRLLESPASLDRFQILTIPGGFSYGDDLGAGRIMATRLAAVLGDALPRFRDRGGLILGICNGFQVLVRAGLLPGNAGDARDLGGRMIAVNSRRGGSGCCPLRGFRRLWILMMRSNCRLRTARETGSGGWLKAGCARWSRADCSPVCRCWRSSDAGVSREPEWVAWSDRGAVRRDGAGFWADAASGAFYDPVSSSAMDECGVDLGCEGDGMRIFRGRHECVLSDNRVFFFSSQNSIDSALLAWYCGCVAVVLFRDWAFIRSAAGPHLRI